MSLSPGWEVISCPLLTTKVSGSALSPLARTWRGVPVWGDAQHNPSCCCCCFLQCLSTHQTNCSPPAGPKSRLSLGLRSRTPHARGFREPSGEGLHNEIAGYTLLSCDLDRVYFDITLKFSNTKDCYIVRCSEWLILLHFLPPVVIWSLSLSEWMKGKMIPTTGLKT